MKKSIIKNLIALTFALGALVFVAGNVFADHTEDVDYIEDQGGGGGTTVGCHKNVDTSNKLSFWWDCSTCTYVPGTLINHDKATCVYVRPK